MSSTQNLEFSNTVAERLQFYVYRLVDPRDGNTFYVGKGKGNRVFQHARDQLTQDSLAADEDEGTAKLAHIRNIRNAGLNVQYVIHRHELSEPVAFEVEAAVMDAYPGIDNEQGGHGSGDRGAMHPQQVINKYELPEIEFDSSEALLLINVNRLEDYRDYASMLDQVRFAWRLDPKRARQAQYVLAVSRGVIVGAFVADEWLPATAENFPELGKGTVEGRWGFRGRPAAPEVWERYVGEHGKRIANEKLRHVQNPIRYLNI